MATHEWPGVRVLKLPETDRCKILTARWAYLRCRQHHHKTYDFSGRRRKMAPHYVIERLQPLGFEPKHPPSMAERKPDAPVPLARQVVKGFTQMVFSRGLAPTLETPSDPRTARYLSAAFSSSQSWVTLMQARTIAGAVGEAAARFFVMEHRGASEPIDTRELHVREWADRVRHIPSVVVWQRLVEIEEETEDGLKTREVWRTKVFDEEYEYTYEDVPKDYGSKAHSHKTREDGEDETTGWIPIAKNEAGQPMIVDHKAGRCPIVWIQNERDTSGPSSDTDVEGCEELIDKVDVVASMAARATCANLDPTLHVKDQRQWHAMNRSVAKGHGRMIRTSEKGDAQLLETSGATVTMGWETYRNLRDAVLQTTGAVIIDPEVAGSFAQSGKAFSMLWRSMEAAAGEKRVPMAEAIRQGAEIWTSIGNSVGVTTTESESPVGLALPPAKIDRDTARREGYEEIEQAVAEEGTKVLCVHQVGSARYVEVVWPPFHDATPEQFQAIAQSATVATGGKPVLSQRSGVRLALRGGGLPDDVEEELARIEGDEETKVDRMAGAIAAQRPPEPYEEEDDEDEGEGGEEEDEAE